MNRFKLLLCMSFVVAVTVLFSGINVACAQQASPAAAPDSVAAAQERAAAKERAAARAITKRAEMLKKRQEAKKYIQKVIEGQQPGAGSAAPDNTGKEGAK